MDSLHKWPKFSFTLLAAYGEKCGSLEPQALLQRSLRVRQVLPQSRDPDNELKYTISAARQAFKSGTLGYCKLW